MSENGRWRPDRQAIAAVLGCVVLVGCDWVDSAGDGSGPDPVRQAAPITLDELPLNGAAGVLEDRIVRMVVSPGADPASDIRFEPLPLETGALDSCTAIEGFALDQAVDTLQAACAAGVPDCSLPVNRVDDTPAGEPVSLELTIPALRAPIGLRYRIAYGRRIVDADGQGGFVEENTQQIDLCLVPINEAPEAIDDTYVVLENRTLDVGAAQGVLANDEDDDDVSNEPLSAALRTAPSRAASFSLQSDGGFFYEPAAIDGRADVLDTFVYRAGDGGSQSADATVTIRIVTANQAPRQIEDLPALDGRVGVLLSLDFTDFFVDPESNRLSFSFEQPLPDDGSLSLGTNGVLVGVPGRDDAGEYTLTLLVSDGSAELSVPVSLVIEAVVIDAAPVFVTGTVFNQNLRLGRSIIPVSPEFEDPEDEPLTYRMAGAVALSAGLALDEDTGVVSGRPRQRQFLQNLIVEASDPSGNTARSTPFSIRVR